MKQIIGYDEKKTIELFFETLAKIGIGSSILFIPYIFFYIIFSQGFIIGISIILLLCIGYFVGDFICTKYKLI
jgi:hypothetical protein